MAQWDLASRIRDKVNEANLAVIKIRRIKTDVAERIKDAPAEVRAAGDALTKALVSVEEDLYQVRNQSGQDPLNFPIKTNNRLASLLRVTLSGEGRPTGNVEPIFNDLVQELKAETDRLDKSAVGSAAGAEPDAAAHQAGADHTLGRTRRRQRLSAFGIDALGDPEAVARRARRSLVNSHASASRACSTVWDHPIDTRNRRLAGRVLPRRRPSTDTYLNPADEDTSCANEARCPGLTVCW